MAAIAAWPASDIQLRLGHWNRAVPLRSPHRARRRPAHRPRELRDEGRLGAAHRPRRAPSPAAPAGRRLPHFYDGKFHNSLETPALAPANTRDGLLRQWHDERHVGLPGGPIPLATTEFPAAPAELAVTWLGHASALLEIDGQRVLVDPVWGDRVLAVAGVRADPAARAADPAEGRSRRSTPS